MSTEEPAQPGLVRSPPAQLTKVGEVVLSVDMILTLGPEDYYFAEPGVDYPITLKITRVGKELSDGEYVWNTIVEVKTSAGIPVD